MKIQQGRHSWRFVQSAISYVSGGIELKARSTITKLRPEKKFLSWPHMPERSLAALVGYDWQAQVEIKTLENFVANCEKKKINSGDEAQLVGQSFDEFSMNDMKRVVDIERMVTLIKTTLADMKAVSASHNALFKG